MRDFLTVLTYTFRENIRKTTFIVSTAIILVLTVAIMIIPGFINQSDKSGKAAGNEQQTQVSEGNIYIIDNIKILNNDAGFLKLAFPGYKPEFKSASETDSLINRVKEEDKTFLLVLNENNGAPAFEYYYKKYGVGPNPEVLEPVIKNKYISSMLQSAGVNDNITAKVLSAPGLTQNELGKGYLKSTISGVIIIFVLFFAIYFFGYGIATSVASEKTSRVMETLVTSTRPSRIIMGKTAAMGLLGLFQLTLMLSAAVVSYRLFFPKDFELFGASIDFSAYTPFAIIMIILYFVLGYLLYATLNAVAGASVSKSEDVNTAVMPISMISLIAFYAAYFPSAMPNSGNINVVTSIIPFTAPFSMPGRLLMANVPPLELIASITLLLATIVLFSWISIKIYSAAILHYGNRLKLTDFISITKGNN